MGFLYVNKNMIWHLCLVNPMRFDMRDIDCVIKKPARSHELAGFKKLTLII